MIGEPRLAHRSRATCAVGAPLRMQHGAELPPDPQPAAASAGDRSRHAVGGHAIDARPARGLPLAKALAKLHGSRLYSPSAPAARGWYAIDFSSGRMTRAVACARRNGGPCKSFEIAHWCAEPQAISGERAAAHDRITHRSSSLDPQTSRAARCDGGCCGP